jgi:hypothetical protein
MTMHHISGAEFQQPPLPGLLELIDEYETPTDEEVEALFEYLLSHPKRLLREFLRGHDLPVSLTKTELRDRLARALKTGEVSVANLVSLLNEVEGWGDQHIYLFRSTPRQAEDYNSPVHLRSILEEHGILHLYNRRNPLVLPAQPELTAIKHTPERLRLQWVEVREWEEPVPEQDYEDEDIIFRAFRRRARRGIATFDWDLITRHAALMIQRLPSGSDYERERARFGEVLDPLVGMGKFFEPLRVSRAIGRIEDSGEAQRRQYRHETANGYVASFTSPSRKRDAFDDPLMERARQALGANTMPLLGNLYFKEVPGRLDRQIHVKLYPKDQRVGIFGGCSESEVRYLLSRVRHYCG